MNREDILQKSREENEGFQDERERAAFADAGKAGMQAGGIVCFALVIIGRAVLHIPEISMGALTVYFAMFGCSSLTLYRVLESKRHLLWGIAGLAISILFACAIFIKNMG